MVAAHSRGHVAGDIRDTCQTLLALVDVAVVEDPFGCGSDDLWKAD
jgi:hypothetical protein